MNGIEATEAILSYEEESGVKHIPIVALTANALKGDKERFLAEGMDDYLSKPIKIEVLRSMLASYFPEKINGTVSQKNLMPQETSKVPELPLVDIVLCKYADHDASIFNVLLHKMGYRVKVAKDFESMHSILLHHRVKYALFDKRMVEKSVEDEFIQLLERLSVKSLVFVDTMRDATALDRTHYTLTAPNVPKLNLLHTLLVKLNPVKNFTV